jgi:hypothetical protein
MAKKVLKKQALYKAFCREQVKQGLINHADGSWRRFDSNKAMDRDCLSGYNFKR